MGRTYAKFLFSTADFQVKFYAGRFWAKIFISSLQLHWLSQISNANSALSITANIIWFPAKRVTFAVTGHVDNHGSGKSSAAFLGFHTFLGLQIQMQQMFVLLYLYGLLYAQSPVTNIASIREYRRRRRNQLQHPYIIGFYPVQMNLGLRYIITILQFQMISLDNSWGWEGLRFKYYWT